MESVLSIYGMLFVIIVLLLFTIFYFLDQYTSIRRGSSKIKDVAVIKNQNEFDKISIRAVIAVNILLNINHRFNSYDEIWWVFDINGFMVFCLSLLVITFLAMRTIRNNKILDKIEATRLDNEIEQRIEDYRKQKLDLNIVRYIDSSEYIISVGTTRSSGYPHIIREYDIIISSKDVSISSNDKDVRDGSLCSEKSTVVSLNDIIKVVPEFELNNINHTNSYQFGFKFYLNTGANLLGNHEKPFIDWVSGTIINEDYPEDIERFIHAIAKDIELSIKKIRST